MKEYKMWINGKFTKAISGKTYSAVNPANAEKIADIPLGDKEDVSRAVQAAKAAFPVWSRKTQAERSKIVFQIAEGIRQNVKEFSRIETMDHGVPIKISSNFHIPMAAEYLEYIAQASRALTGYTLPIGQHALSYIQREPIGVCGLITPWNVPLLMVAWKLGPALAMGNTCVIKPPSCDSLSTLKLAEILEKLDLPPGTVNIVTGPGSTVGEALASDPDVDKIGFTGSCETGKHIMSCASSSVKRLGLELGGKNPFIVMEDADVDAAVEGAVFSSFFNSGMVCASAGRYYIHEKLHDEFVDKFIAETKKIIIGDPSDEKTRMGPVVSKEHRDKVESYIQSGINEGATLMLGGKRPTNPPLNKGYYIMPTIFINVTQNIKIAKEEIFGPVACILKFSSEDEVIRLANESVFGLAASIWTKDTTKGIQFANALRVGFVWINDSLIIWPEQPWGGFRESGFGKDNSFHVFEEYSQLKVVSIDLTKKQRKPWYELLRE